MGLIYLLFHGTLIPQKRIDEIYAKHLKAKELPPHAYNAFNNLLTLNERIELGARIEMEEDKKRAERYEDAIEILEDSGLMP